MPPGEFADPRSTLAKTGRPAFTDRDEQESAKRIRGSDAGENARAKNKPEADPRQRDSPRIWTRIFFERANHAK